jgi:ATP-dependent exoDNAse (exonuclease V) beta subunit
MSEYPLERYGCSPWRGKISLQMKGSADLSERVFSAQKWGIELHNSLGKLSRIEDLPNLEDADLKTRLKLIVRHEEIEPYFTDIEAVKTESAILLPGGKRKRLDRLIKKNGEWIVIDFKTGKKKKTDNDQVLEYVKILSEMEYQPIRGVLIYLDPVEVIPVNGG